MLSEVIGGEWSPGLGWGFYFLVATEGSGSLISSKRHFPALYRLSGSLAL